MMLKQMSSIKNKKLLVQVREFSRKKKVRESTCSKKLKVKLPSTTFSNLQKWEIYLLDAIFFFFFTVNI